MNDQRKNYFYCYSINLLRFIRQHGVQDIFKGVHEKTKNTFWVFERNDALKEILDKWK